MTLAQIRHNGVIINLKPDGGLGVVGATPAVIEAIKQNRASIIATLKRERLDGIGYHDSKVYWSLNVLYDSWYSLPESEERSNALRLCARWDNALTDNFKAGAQMVIDEQPMLELLAESAPLEGVTLHRTLSAMVGDMPQKQTPVPRAVSVSALDGPVVTPTPKPQGKYTQALRELLSIAQSKGGEAARGRAAEAIASEFDRLANGCGLKYREGMTYEDACDMINKKLESDHELAKRLGITPVQDDLFSSPPPAQPTTERKATYAGLG